MNKILHTTAIEPLWMTEFQLVMADSLSDAEIHDAMLETLRKFSEKLPPRGPVHPEVRRVTSRG